jgi:hypothetical protein
VLEIDHDQIAPVTRLDPTGGESQRSGTAGRGCIEHD